MQDVTERFLRFVQVDSQSDHTNHDETPSTPRQHHMAAYLGDELRRIGCDDVRVDEHAYVTATLPASVGAEDAPALVLCSHLDTSPDAPAAGVKPHIVHYEGGPLVSGVVGGTPVQTTPDELPALLKYQGHDIVVSDGSTLLGADDKAGVAEICALLARLVANPALPHPRLEVAFVPDEEIGHGACLLDLDRLGARWGYTVDGGDLGEINYECFCASEATVRVHGVQVHPGAAKGVMKNAVTIAAQYQALIPNERPETTDGREGYFHPAGIVGACDEATLRYLLRDFDSQGLERREKVMRDAAQRMNERWGAGTVEVDVRREYRNMAERFTPADQLLIDLAFEANREVGIEPVAVPVRGGTDGAQLTYRGLPCPNLAAGGFNAHSVREFVPVSSLEKTVDMLECLAAKLARVRG